jgi:hypothetical protein
MYVGGATTSTGLIGASEAVVQNELGIQFGDATGTYMRLIANGANSNTAIQAGAFSGANPSLDLIAAGGTTAISIKNDAGVNFDGALTASIYKVNSGGGIDFSANSNPAGMTSELLNDYEEGTWTPVIRGSGTAGTYELTHVSHYTKIGRQVTLTSRITMASSITGGGTNYLQITGLPFAKLDNSDTVGSIEVNGLDTTGNYLVVKFITLSASSILFISDVNDNATPTDLPVSAISANDSIGLTITYFV